MSGSLLSSRLGWPIATALRLLPLVLFFVVGRLGQEATSASASARQVASDEREFVRPPGLVGSRRCRLCHRAVYESWEQTAHAASERFVGAASCLVCHATAPDVSGVHCEACHGPGEYYWPAEVMLDRDKAISAGLRVGAASESNSNSTERMCLACHDSNAMPDGHRASEIPNRPSWAAVVHALSEK